MFLRKIVSVQSMRNLSKTIQLTGKQDAGIKNQVKLLKTSPQDVIEGVELDEYETDFMNAHESYKDHKKELRALKEREKYLIVKQKYFKEKYPNFLTWQEKEQIRYLHNQDPQEWSVEKLAESFPALPEIIQKIVKSKWMKDSEAKIRNHDKAVKTNWEEFKSGKHVNLPEDLKQHLQKFTSRSLIITNVNNSDNKVVKSSNSLIKGEFSEIISSYERLKCKNSTVVSQKTPTNVRFDDKPIKSKRKELYTLKELGNTIKQQSVKNYNKVSDDDKHLLQCLDNNNNSSIIELKNTKDSFNEIVEQKYESSNKVGVVTKHSRDVSHLVYPETITIPKKLYKSKSLYKLNDCYYTSDGQFLYRVPGMS